MVYNMNQLLIILFLFVGSFAFGQTDTIYLENEYFITDWRYKDQLKIRINRRQEIEPIEIKDRLYIIPYRVYLENKELVESKIDLYKCIIRNVKRNELLEYEF